ncbi:ATP-binding protein [Sphingopyxis sp.]|uniref:sensor histidine kinase n=1 Tax=Sphingopyxis sp. TaxID=1908224 RepID=UPI001D37A016|nr:sensor histidine kinase [Sphingopyxis sp.]MBW8296397.1 CHASE3 domain-containing protein [Sphingopyxis sp.]
MKLGKPAPLGRDARANRAIIVLLGVGFAALLFAAAAVFWVQRDNEASAALVSHTLAVEVRLGGFASSNERLETARRGLLLTGNPAFATIMGEAEVSARKNLAAMMDLTRDNPTQQQRTARLRALLDAYGTYHRRSVQLTGAARQEMLANFMNDTGVGYVREARRVVETMLDEELRLLRSREARQKQTQFLFTATLAGTGLLILIVAAATLFLVRRNLAELRDSREELNNLNAGLEQLVDARTAELQRANSEIQRFAYIVSHDLRSPLVNVMGFTAELEAARKAIAGYIERSDAEGWAAPDRDTRLAIDEDLPEAIGFIRSSTQKMDRLINAILQLSRQGRRTLAPEHLDLTAIASGISDSLHHRVEETGTTLTIEPLPPVVNDRVAVEQILSNLIENALKYLKPGVKGQIGVTGRTEYGRVIVEVSDNGRGIDPRDHERIFDLFRRSGAQDQPGEGIGLAHARALAYRLGGFIEVASALGEGSTFRLILPSEWRGGNGDD